MEDQEKAVLTMEFPNEKSLREFMTWMSHSGEQDYWNAMESTGVKNIVDDFRYDYGEKKIICT